MLLGREKEIVPLTGETQKSCLPAVGSKGTKCELQLFCVQPDLRSVPKTSVKPFFFAVTGDYL